MKTVLLVDGDGAALAELGGGLAALAPEVRVVTARHGAEAVERLRAGPVDVLATALVMPVMDGFAFTRCAPPRTLRCGEEDSATPLG
jgi:CheY-like chemotaxis protein